MKIEKEIFPAGTDSRFLREVQSLNQQEILNPFHPNISMHILHTANRTFLKVLTRRICLTIKTFFFLLVIISFILVTFMCNSEEIL